jgi:hypothetical protein
MSTPAPASAIARYEPMNPAPPVTSARVPAKDGAAGGIEEV